MTRSSRPSFPAVIAALALFVGGTQYCLVAALAGPLGMEAMSCHAADTAPAAPAKGSCHGGASERPDRSPSPCSPGFAPCCIAIAPVPHQAPLAAPVDALLAIENHEIAILEGPETRGFARPFATESPPLDRSVTATPPGRAPPLA